MKGPMILTFGGVAFFVVSLAVMLGSFMLPALTNGRTSPAEAMMGIIPGALCAGLSGMICLGGIIWLIVAAASGSKQSRTAAQGQFGHAGAATGGGIHPAATRAGGAPAGFAAAGVPEWQQPSAYAQSPPTIPPKFGPPVARPSTPGDGRLFLLLGGVGLCVLFVGGAVAAGTYILMSLDFRRDELRPAQADGNAPNDAFAGPWHDGGPGGGDPNVWTQPGAGGSPFETQPFADPALGPPHTTFDPQEFGRLNRDVDEINRQQIETMRRQQEEIRRQNEELLRRTGPGLRQPPTPPGFRPPF